MAETSLLQLGNEFIEDPQALATRVVTPREPNATPVPKNVQPVAERSDELMRRAHELTKPSDEEIYSKQMYDTREALVEQRIAQDPNYAAYVLPKLENAANRDEYVQHIFDEGDNEIIYQKKVSDPNFTAVNAAKTAFANAALFGQLSRVIGYSSELINGVPAEQVIREKAEEFRILQKAFPKSNLVGQAAAFFTPGSPAKILFGKLATAGAKGAAMALGKLAEGGVKAAANPLVQSMARMGAEGAAGVGGVEGLQGFLGADNQKAFDIDRGAEEAASKGLVAFAFGAGLPLAGKALTTTGKAAMNVAGKVVPKLDNVVEAVTGTSARALRAYNQKGAQITEAFGTEVQIGDDIVDFLLDPRKSRIPEAQQAKALLSRLPDVETRPVLDLIEKYKAKALSRPDLKPYAQKLEEWSDNIKARMSQTGTKLPAREMRNLVDDLQDAAAEAGAWGKESKFFEASLKQVARKARLEIKTLAESTAGGEAGKTYNGLMAKAAEKMKTVDFLRKQFGRHPETMKARAESVVDRWIGKNSSVKEAMMKKFDQQYGTNFFERTSNAQMAQELGNGGVPALLPEQATGRAMLGTITGGAVGGYPGALIGAMASSPKVGAMVIGASDKIQGFVEAMSTKPQVIAEVVKNKAVPEVIRRMANEINVSLQKDGVPSAAGVTRLIADTPFFFPLIHAFDLQDRKMQQKERASQASNQVTPSGVARQGNGY